MVTTLDLRRARMARARSVSAARSNPADAELARKADETLHEYRKLHAIHAAEQLAAAEGKELSDEELIALARPFVVRPE